MLEMMKCKVWFNHPILPWFMGLCVTSQLLHQNFNHGICLPSSCQKSGWERKPEQLALQFLPTTAEFSPYEVSTVGSHAKKASLKLQYNWSRIVFWGLGMSTNSKAPATRLCGLYTEIDDAAVFLLVNVANLKKKSIEHSFMQRVNTS